MERIFRFFKNEGDAHLMLRVVMRNERCCHEISNLYVVVERSGLIRYPTIFVEQGMKTIHRFCIDKEEYVPNTKLEDLK